MEVSTPGGTKEREKERGRKKARVNKGRGVRTTDGRINKRGNKNEPASERARGSGEGKRDVAQVYRNCPGNGRSGLTGSLPSQNCTSLLFCALQRNKSTTGELALHTRGGDKGKMGDGTPRF